MSIANLNQKYPWLKYALAAFFLILSLKILDTIAYNYALRFNNIQLFSITPDLAVTNTRPVMLPHSELSTPIQDYIYTMETEYRLFYPTTIHIIPDDKLVSLKVNGLEVSLRDINPAKLADWQNGFQINIGNYLKEGVNKIEAYIKDEGGGRFGFSAVNTNPSQNLIYLIFLYLSITLLLLLLYFALKALKFERIPMAILLSAFFVLLLNLSRTDYNTYSYDLLEGGTGHLNYIEYVVNNNALPRPDSGWVYYHPGLYYITAAVFYRAEQFLGIMNIYKGLQSLSLMFFMVFLVFAALILRKMVKDKIFFAVALAVLAFWPSGFIHSIRIGNDVLFYTFFAAALYFINDWYKSRSMKDLYLATLFASLDFMTKTNGAIIVAIVLLLLLFEFLKQKDKLAYIRKMVWVLVIFAASFGISRFNHYYYAIKEQRSDWYLAGLVNITATTSGGLYVGNQPINYIYFDLPTMMTEPYVSTWVDKGGRQYFWNFLLKSSMFGEFSYEGTLRALLSILLNNLFLLMCAYFVAAVFFWGFTKRDRHLPVRESGNRPMFYSAYGRRFRNTLFMKTARRTTSPLLIKVELTRRHYFSRYKNRVFEVLLLAVLLSVLMMIAYRINKPLSALADFRYVYPLLISFLVLFCFALEVFRDKSLKKLVNAGLIIGSAFAVIAGLFFLLPR